MKQVLLIGGMHCPMCSGRVMRVLSNLSGVEACEVQLESSCAVLTVKEPIAEAVLKEAVENLGFDFLRVEEEK